MKGKRRPLPIVAILSGGLLLLAAASCSLERKGRTASGQSDPSAPVANPFCRACHLDFDEEEFALDHESAGIGCERCHGESLRHRSDEANITPPELMYPKERINPTCMMCHPRNDIRHVKDHRPILEAGLSIFETGLSGENAKKYCTDCHGVAHRMKVRDVRWDKGTGALLR